MIEKYEDLMICYSDKSDGNMSKKFGENADSNRRKFLQKLNLPINRFLFMQPDNSDKIVELKEDVIKVEDLYYKLIEADAIICSYPNIYLYLSFADCIPFTIYDKKKHVFAFAHLGWRSTYLNLHQKLFSVFKEKFNSSIEDLIIHIGPCIKKENYLLETPKQLEEDAWRPYIEYVKENLYSIDLSGYVSDFFLEKGMLKSQILVSDIDTYSNLNYYSHYRATRNKEEIEGRFFYCVGMNAKEE